MLTLLALTLGPDIPVKREGITVGRNPECDAQVRSPWVSRRHCLLTGEGHEVVVCDLDSRNGTWINGQRVKSGRLKPGDEIAIGYCRYRLERKSESDTRK